MQNYLNLQVKSDADQEELNFDKIFSEYISLEPSIESEVISQKQKDS